MSDLDEMFYFRVNGFLNGTVYSATKLANNYLVEWKSSITGLTNSTEYPVEVVEEFMENQTWIRVYISDLPVDNSGTEISLTVRKGALYVEKKFHSFEELTSYALAAEEAFDY